MSSRKSKIRAVVAEDKGFALIAVLWVLVALSLIATVLLASARSDYRLSANQVTLAEMQYAAEGAINSYIRELLAAAPSERNGLVEISRRYVIGDHAVTIQAGTEAGRINLNLAPREMFTTYLLEGEIDEAMALKLSGTIIDWRDPDGIAWNGGAESTSLATTIFRNDNFRSVSELLQVPGVGDALSACDLADFTIYSDMVMPNYADAGPRVRAALTAFAAKDSSLATPGDQASIFAPASNQLSGPISIIAEVMGDRISFSMTAVVRITGNVSEPFELLQFGTLSPARECS